MKRLLIATMLAALALVVGQVWAHHGPAEVTFETKMGAVAFPHAAHQDDLKIECATCHHTGTEMPKCSSCHGVKEGAPSAKDAFHAKCKGCHQEKGGPTGCKDCHKK